MLDNWICGGEAGCRVQIDSGTKGNYDTDNCRILTYMAAYHLRSDPGVLLVALLMVFLGAGIVVKILYKESVSSDTGE